MTGPERTARQIAHGIAGRHLTARKLAKRAGCSVDAARHALTEAEAARKKTPTTVTTPRIHTPPKASTMSDAHGRLSSLRCLPIPWFGNGARVQDDEGAR